MHRPLWSERYQPSDAEIIKEKARKMIGHYGYRACNLADLEQELALHVVRQMHLYRATRGTRAQFVSQITKNKLLNLIEHRRAQKRDDRRNVTIEVVDKNVLPGDGTTPAGRDLGIDVRAVLERLPQELRQVANLLPERSGQEIGRLLGLSRGQVRWRIQQIGQALSAAGLAPNSQAEQPSGETFR
ncbi:MAG: hypothetical protein IT442_17185 [Phycisphaeraceae bacterium]|nr:hypothetical protein [Phycisphaeraceae bacterium]